MSAELTIAIKAQDEASAKLKELGRNLEQVGSNAKSVSQTVERSGRSFRELSGQISATGQSFMRLYNLYDNIQDAQLRLDQANNRMVDTQIRLQRAQEAYNNAVAKYGENSQEALTAMVTLQQVQADLAIATDRAENAQENLTKTWINAGIQAIPSLLTSMTSLKDLAGSLVGVKLSLASATTTATGAMTSLHGSALIATGSLGGLKATLLALAGPAGAIALVVAGVAALALLISQELNPAVREARQQLIELEGGMVHARMGTKDWMVKGTAMPPAPTPAEPAPAPTPAPTPAPAPSTPTACPYCGKVGGHEPWCQTYYAFPFQRGGIVTKPTLALLGERGPEAVVPLREGREQSARKIEVQVNTTISSLHVSDERQVQQFIDRHYRKIVAALQEVA